MIIIEIFHIIIKLNINNNHWNIIYNNKKLNINNNHWNISYNNKIKY